jgi:anti-sigma factor RsiW
MLAVRRHLQGCNECRAECEALAQVRRLLGALPTVPLRAGSEERALARLTGDPPRERRWFGPRWCRARSPRWVARGAAWAGAASLALVAWLVFAGLRQPQQPDAVVAMIRPSEGLGEMPANFGSPWPEVWPPERLAPWATAGWRPGGYQLIQQRPTRF